MKTLEHVHEPDLMSGCAACYRLGDERRNSHTSAVPLGDRDFDYVEARLLAPALPVGEAINRLRQLGRMAEADRLLEAAKQLVDATRAVRNELSAERSRRR